MKKRLNTYAFFFILLGILLRFFYLGNHSFWCDEFLAISLGKLRLTDMACWVIRNDAHPPLFYGIVHFLMKAGQSEPVLRSVSAISGILSLLVFYLFLKRFWKGNILLPLTLFVLSPAAVLWSQILKSYSLLTLFGLLSVYFFFAFQEIRRVSFGLIWFITTMIILCLHNYGMLIFAGEVLTGLFFFEKNYPKKGWLPVAGIILLGYLSYSAGPLFSQIHFVHQATHSVTNPFLRLVYTFYYFVLGETVSPLNLKFVLPGLILFLFSFLASFSRKGLSQTTPKTNEPILAFSYIVLSLALLVVFLIPATIPQNLIHLQPFFFLIIASGINNIAKRPCRIGLSVLLPLVFLPSLYYYYRGDSLQYHDVSKLVPYRQISREIERAGTDGEVILFTGDSRDRRFAQFFPPYSGWDWYYRGGLPLKEINPAVTNDLTGTLTEITGNYQGFWLLLRYGANREWNEEMKSFFFKLEREGKMVKMTEKKMLRNDSFLARLRGKPESQYYFMEVYHFTKEG
ncbi:MAG: hypothetical protein V2A65_00955 [Candidatus Omnitrophota bacterium]